MLPAAASLKKQGANNGATTAFLISTPESGVDSIAVSYALLDPVMTVVRPVAAFITAISAGLLENLFFWRYDERQVRIDRSCPVDGCCDGEDCPDEIHRHHHTFYEKVLAGLRFGYKEVWGDIAVWFYAGLFLAALISTFVPEDLMARLLGGGLSSMLVMLVVGIPLYICATASTPVAAALILKGVSPGAALVFLLVGPATNITSLSVLTTILGKRGTIRYLVVLSASAVALGLGLDVFYQALHISPRAIMGSASELVPAMAKTTAAVLLLVISIQPLWLAVKKKFGPKPKPEVFVSGFPLPMHGELHGHSDGQKPRKNPGCNCCD